MCGDGGGGGSACNGANGKVTLAGKVALCVAGSKQRYRLFQYSLYSYTDLFGLMLFYVQ